MRGVEMLAAAEHRGETSEVKKRREEERHRGKLTKRARTDDAREEEVSARQVSERA